MQFDAIRRVKVIISYFLCPIGTRQERGRPWRPVPTITIIMMSHGLRDVRVCLAHLVQTLGDKTFSAGIRKDAFMSLIFWSCYSLATGIFHVITRSGRARRCHHRFPEVLSVLNLVGVQHLVGVHHLLGRICSEYLLICTIQYFTSIDIKFIRLQQALWYFTTGSFADIHPLA